MDSGMEKEGMIYIMHLGQFRAVHLKLGSWSQQLSRHQPVRRGSSNSLVFNKVQIMENLVGELIGYHPAGSLAMYAGQLATCKAAACCSRRTKGCLVTFVRRVTRKWEVESGQCR